jgi:hypothetical protein
VLVVGASVGLAAVIGTLRFLYGWSLKPLIHASLGPVLGLSLYAANVPELRSALGLAWDTGAVTTEPVTVLLVLSLGIGIAAAAGKGDAGRPVSVSSRWRRCFLSAAYCCCCCILPQH